VRLGLLGLKPIQLVGSARSWRKGYRIAFYRFYGAEGDQRRGLDRRREGARSRALAHPEIVVQLDIRKQRRMTAQPRRSQWEGGPSRNV
jgi:hypothetical protein